MQVQARAQVSDRQLVRDLKSGDGAVWRSALAAVDDRYAGRLRIYASGRVPEDHVEDLVQDTFEALMQSIARDVGILDLKAWLYGVAHHKIVNYYRRQRAVLPLDDALLESEILEDDLLARLSLGQGVADAIARLTKADRETVVLSFWCDLTNDEIAAIRGVTPRSVAVSKSRALVAMRRHLAQSEHSAC